MNEAEFKKKWQHLPDDQIEVAIDHLIAVVRHLTTNIDPTLIGEYGDGLDGELLEFAIDVSRDARFSEVIAESL